MRQNELANVLPLCLKCLLSCVWLWIHTHGLVLTEVVSSVGLVLSFHMGSWARTQVETIPHSWKESRSILVCCLAVSVAVAFSVFITWVSSHLTGISLRLLTDGVVGFSTVLERLQPEQGSPRLQNAEMCSHGSLFLVFAPKEGC